MRPLVGADAQVFELLQRIVSIGRHRRAWTRADVARVCSVYFAGNAHQRAIEAERERTDQARAEARRLAEHIAVLEQDLLRYRNADRDELPPRKVVELNRSEYETFALFCEGRPRQSIADELGLAKGTVSNYVSHVSELIDADAAKAAALVNRGVVAIRTRGQAA